MTTPSASLPTQPQPPEGLLQKPALKGLAAEGLVWDLLHEPHPEFEKQISSVAWIGTMKLARQVEDWREEEGDPSLDPTALPESRLMPDVDQNLQEKMLAKLQRSEARGLTYLQLMVEDGILPEGSTTLQGVSPYADLDLEK